MYIYNPGDGHAFDVCSVTVESSGSFPEIASRAIITFLVESEKVSTMKATKVRPINYHLRMRTRALNFGGNH